MEKNKDIITFTVPGSPQSLKRHRTFRRGDFVGQYDPSKGDKQDFLAKCMEYKPSVPWSGPLRVDLLLFFPRPRSHFRTGKYAGELKPNAPLWCDKNPDRSNVEKFVEDALNGIFWSDDRIICDGVIQKKYSDRPRIEITIERIEL